MGYIWQIPLFYFSHKFFGSYKYPVPQIFPYTLLFFRIFLYIFSVSLVNAGPSITAFLYNRHPSE
jgi:hypothetical protein